jgi:hypothetical protein
VIVKCLESGINTDFLFNNISIYQINAVIIIAGKRSTNAEFPIENNRKNQGVA